VIDDFIQQLQDDQYFALLSDAELADVFICRRRTPLAVDGDGNPVVGDTVSIEDKLNEVLAGAAERNGKNGVGIIVMLPDVKLESSQSSSLPLVLKSKIRIVENQLFNESASGTGLTASRLALHVAQLMQRRAFRSGNALRCDPAKAVEEINLPGYNVHEVNVEYTRYTNPRVKVADVVIEQDGSGIALTCSTASSRIYYTLDESFPGSGNQAAQLYTAPLTLDPGEHVLRVAAEADDHQASNDLIADITVS
jgi:hypothetical protein